MSEKVYLELQDQEIWEFQSTDGDVIYTNKISRFEKVKTINIFHFEKPDWAPEFELSEMELPALESIWLINMENAGRNVEIESSKLFQAIDAKSLANVTNIEIYDEIAECLPDWMQHCTGITKLNITQMMNLKELPSWFSQLLQLEILTCYVSGFSEIPPQIFSLTNIKNLAFNKGHRITVIPDEIKNLQSLRILNLWNTTFTYVSPELFLLPNIQEFNLFATSYPNIPPETMNAIKKLQREKPFVEIWWLRDEKPYRTYTKTFNNNKNQQVMDKKLNQTSKGWRLLTSLKKWLFLVVIFTVLLACSNSNTNIPAVKTTEATPPEKPKAEVEKYTFRIIPALENTFGYEILDQGKILVQQKSIPSLPGNRGFHTEDDAEKCAVFVISKLNRNIMPPSVTPEELDSLGIIINSKILN